MIETGYFKISDDQDGMRKKDKKGDKNDIVP